MTMDAEEFILAVKDRPAIWMSGHPHHKFSYAVMSAWMEIKVLYPDYSIERLKKRWKGLKDTYRKELKKHPNLQTGELPENINVKWRHFKDLNFLRDELIFAEGTNNLQNDLNQCCDDDSQSTNSETCPLSDNVKPSLPIEDDIQTQTSTKPRRNDKRLAHDDAPKSPKRVRTERSNELLYQSRPEHEARPEHETRSTDYYFLMSILPQMEKFRPIQKLRIRNKINEVIIEEMKNNK